MDRVVRRYERVDEVHVPATAAAVELRRGGRRRSDHANEASGYARQTQTDTKQFPDTHISHWTPIRHHKHPYRARRSAVSAINFLLSTRTA
jgi:hypothetical protein